MNREMYMEKRENVYRSAEKNQEKHPCPYQSKLHGNDSPHCNCNKEREEHCKQYSNYLRRGSK